VRDLSGDGRVAVGWCGAAAVRWVDGQAEALDVPGVRPSDPNLPPPAFDALQTSHDGATFLGRTHFEGVPAGGWIWRAGSGPARSAHEILREAGIDPGGGDPDGRTLFDVAAFALDGKVLVGAGEHGPAASRVPFLYRVTLP
jgi:hypothetical protein